MKIGNIECYGVIYKITNTINNKVYIGQTINGFDERYANNLYGRTHNEHLKRSIEKYSIENFDVCKIYDVAFSKEELDMKEIIYIELFDSTNPNKGYNKRDGGSNGSPSEETIKKIQQSLIGHEVSEETKIKIGESNKGKMLGDKNHFYGKHHTEESKVKISKANKGRKWSDEAKQQMSESRKGMESPMKGKHHSEETKKKLSELGKGRTLSEESKIKISKANKGNRHTEDSKKKMSDAKKDKYYGENNPFYGKHHTDESKEKQRLAHLGKKYSEETKRKMSESKKGKNSLSAKSVICLTTKKIFYTAKEGAEYYNIKNGGHIGQCCKGKLKSCGKLNDGTKLVWRYLVWNHNKKYRIK